MSEASTLFPAGVNPPRLPPFVVARPRLLERLDGAIEAGVGLVCAGAGYGKTTLLGAWVAGLESQVDTAWLTLQRDHDDSALLAIHLHEALELAGVDFASTSLEEVVAGLAHHSAARDRPTLLVLEDIHQISSDAALGVLARLLDRRPPNLVIVISSRTEPPLQWHGLRAAGALVEVGAAHLAFDTMEIRELFERRFDLLLPSDRVEDIYRLTEGWPAAVCLLGIALREADDPIAVLAAHPERHRFVLGYVEEQVLGTLDAERLRFLEDTSVLSRLDPELCDELIGRGDALQTLRGLVVGNMFTEELVADRPVFRYHPLFRERLRARLDLRRPEEAAELLERASRWYEQRGMLVEAIDTALRSGDMVRAEELIRAACGPALRHGLAATVVRWVESLPPALVASCPELLLVLGRANGLMGDVTAALEVFDAARQAVAAATAPASPAFAVAFAQIELSTRLWEGRLASLREPLSGIALERVNFDDPLLRMLEVDRESLSASIGLAHLLSGEWSEAIDLATAQIAMAAADRRSRFLIMAFGVKALALAWQGDEREARATIRRGSRALARFRGESGEPVGLHVATAWVGEGEEGDAALRRATAIAERVGLPLLQALASLGALRVRLRRGDLLGSRKALAHAEVRLAELPEPAVLAMVLERLKAEYSWLSAAIRPELTSREIEVLRAVARGMTRSQIARELHYSVNTVKTHLRTAYRKLAVHTAEEAVARARALGLLPRLDLAAPTSSARASTGPSAVTRPRS